MRFHRIFSAFLCACWLSASATSSAHEPTPTGAHDIVTENFSRAISNVPGKSLVAVEVVYPPGGASYPHVHARSAFIYAYVVSGSIVSKVNDQPARLYKAGQSFFEEPGARHAVSRNASKIKPAKLLAVFVVDSDDTTLTTHEIGD